MLFSFEARMRKQLEKAYFGIFFLCVNLQIQILCCYFHINEWPPPIIYRSTSNIDMKIEPAIDFYNRKSLVPVSLSLSV